MKEQEVKKKTDLVVRKAIKMKVTNQKSLSLAETMIVEVKSIIKGVREYFDEPIRKAHEAHKSIVAKRKEAEDPLLKAEVFLKNAVKDYLVKVEEARRAAEEKARFEQEALLAKLDEERKTDDEKAADTTRAALEEIHLESMKVKEDPKMTGVTKKKLIRWHVIDLDLVPRDLLTVDKPRVDEIVKRMKLNAAIPGIEVYEDLVIATKRS